MDSVYFRKLYGETSNLEYYHEGEEAEESLDKETDRSFAVKNDLIFSLGENGSLPRKSTTWSAGYDVELPDDVVLKEGFSKIYLGINLEYCPKGSYLSLVGRSSVGKKYGLMVISGVIDADYEGGEIFGQVFNPSDPISLKKGEKLFQLIHVSLQCRKVGTPRRLIDPNDNGDLIRVPSAKGYRYMRVEGKEKKAFKRVFTSKKKGLSRKKF